MADTRLKYRPDKKCDDCGELGTSHDHWGDLVPEEKRYQGNPASFCGFCYARRSEEIKTMRNPLPLGVKLPGVPPEFNKKTIRVTAKNDAVYKFGLPNEEGIREVSCNGEEEAIDFTKAKIISLVLGQKMWLKPIDSTDEGLDFWITSESITLIE
jgi:hypothetical protein